MLCPIVTTPYTHYSLVFKIPLVMHVVIVMHVYYSNDIITLLEMVIKLVTIYKNYIMLADGDDVNMILTRQHAWPS